MVIVRTKEELQEAIKNKATSIRIEGPYAGVVAKKIRSRRKKKKLAMGVGALALVGGAVAAPFTGGASFVASAMGATAMGLTIGTVTISTVELAMILGFAGYLIHNKYNVKIGNKDKYIEFTSSK